MDVSEFFSLVERVQARWPIWFQLDRDPPATDCDLATAQDCLSVTLPPEYVAFVKRFGGGYFAFANVYSLEEKSDWNIVLRNREAGLPHRGFIAFSENGVGDCYVFRVDAGTCSSRVFFFDHETANIGETGYANLFDYLRIVALRGES